MSAGQKRPAGWYGKEERAKRAAIHHAKKAAAAERRMIDQAGKAQRERKMLSIRNCAKNRLAQVMAGFNAERRAAEPKQDPIAIARRIKILEEARVARLIDRDRTDRKREIRRALAREEVEQGVFVNIDQAVLEPPTEQTDRGFYVPYTPEKLTGTARAPTTVKNLAVDSIGRLLRMDVIDLPTWKACANYRETWELSGLSPRMTASYAEPSTGQRAYGLMPRTEMEIDTREDYRWQRSQIPEDVIDLFEAVVLYDQPLSSQSEGTRYANTRAAFKRAAFALFEAVKVEIEIED